MDKFEKLVIGLLVGLIMITAANLLVACRTLELDTQQDQGCDR
jgi:hypothetical protein